MCFANKHLFIFYLRLSVHTIHGDASRATQMCSHWQSQLATSPPHQAQASPLGTVAGSIHIYVVTVETVDNLEKELKGLFFLIECDGFNSYYANMNS